MNILSFSYCFPHAAAPTWGVFVERRLAALARRPGVELQVVSPVPSFPLVTRWRRGVVPAREVWNGLLVHRPPFFCVPGLFKSLDARLYARGVAKRLGVGSWDLGAGKERGDWRSTAEGMHARAGMGDHDSMPDASSPPLPAPNCQLPAPIFQLPAPSFQLPAPSFQLPAEGFRPDVLDAHFIWPDGVGVSLLAKRLGLPYVITLRGGLWVSFLNPRIKRQSVQALKDATAVISLSQSMVDVCVELGVPREKFTVITNGVDLSAFTIGDRDEARRRLGLPMDKRLIVCVAFYQARKGILELLNALTTLPSDVHLVLVGTKVGHQVDFYRKVFSECERLGVAYRVHHEGPQPHERIADYFRAADVSALPSYWEGCPNAVLESLACGRPVVATPVGAVPDLISPGVNGQIVPVRDAAALAAALQAVLAREWDPEAVRRSPAVRSWDDVAEEVEKVLENRRSEFGDGRSGGEVASC